MTLMDDLTAFNLTLVLIVAAVLDWILGEPAKYHPLVGFGNLANKLERKANTGTPGSRLVKGCLCWCVLVLPVPLLLGMMTSLPSFSQYAQFILDTLVVYWALGQASLRQHGLQIYQALKTQNLKQAQMYTGYIVSRDTSVLDETQICRATTESMLENGHDAVIATLFWYVIGGAPFVILHRLANTLDAMWGYKNNRYIHFGKYAARADDLLGYLSAKVTAILFAFLAAIKKGSVLAIIRILKQAYFQAQGYKSLNGGWAMSAGASLIQVTLGGISRYDGIIISSPVLGEGEPPQAKHIWRSLSAVAKACILFVLLTFLTELVIFSLVQS